MSEAAKKKSYFLHGYELVSVLGEGHDATVYCAQKNGQNFAIKVPHKNTSDVSDPLERFRREAYTLARLSHPSLPQVIEIGEEEGQPFLVMELLKGQTLAQSLGPESRFSDNRSIEIAIAVAGALSEIHRNHLVHRDVKAENIMLCQDGSARLIDLGMVGDHETLAQDGKQNLVLGTFQYSSPEQSGILKRRVDSRSDLYSLGVTLFQMVTGQLPFTATDISELLQQHASLTPPLTCELRPETSPVLAQIIAKLLQKDPDDRYQSAMGLLYDLENTENLQTRWAQAGSVQLATRDVSEGPLTLRLEGRDQELKVLKSKLKTALSGRSQSLLIQAESGMGKSRLAQEMLDLAHLDHMVVLQSKCTDKGRSIPLGAIREALDSVTRWMDRLQKEDQERFLKSLRKAAQGLEPALLRVCSPRLTQILFEDSARNVSDSQAGMDQLLSQTKDFLLRLAETGHKILFFIDDIQWADDLTVQFLTEITASTHPFPLLTLMTIRKENAADFRSLASGAQLLLAVKDSTLELGPLNKFGIQGCLKTLLGARQIRDEVIETVFKASGGTPLLVHELTLALLNRGDLNLENDSWTLKEGALSRLDFSKDVYRLILARAAKFTETQMRVAILGAVIGLRFESSLLAQLLGRPQTEIESVLSNFENIHFIEYKREGDEYQFTHDKIREALLQELSSQELGEISFQLALLLEKQSEPSSQIILDIANCYRLSDWKQHPEKAFAAHLKAGQLLLETYGYSSAVEILSAAHEMSRHCQLPQASLFQMHVARGTALMYLGKSDQAFQAFQSARELTSEKMDLAQLLFLECRTYSALGTDDKAWEKMQECLHSIGFHFPKNQLSMLFQTLFFVFRSMLDMIFPFQRGALKKSSHSEKYKKFELAAQALEAGMLLAYHLGDPLSFMYVNFRNLVYAHKLGDSKELVKAHCSVALIGALFVIKPLMRWHLNKAEEISRRLNDPGLLASWTMHMIWCTEFSGSTLESEKIALESGPMVKRYLGTLMYSHMLGDLGGQYQNRGMARETVQFLTSKMSEFDKAQNIGMMVNARGMLVSMGTALGGLPDLNRHHTEWIENLKKIPSNKYAQVSLPGNTILILADQEELGEKFEKAVQDFYDAKIEDHFFKIPHCMIAHMRLKQYEIASTVDQKKMAKKVLSKALWGLKFRATIPLWKCHVALVEAGIQRIDGNFQKVPKLIEKAEALAKKSGSEIARFLAAREWARLQRDLGDWEKAQKEARYALKIAEKNGYANRMKQLAKEFDLSEKETSTAIAGSNSTPPNAMSRVAHLNEKRALDALLQVSLASGVTLDPSGQLAAILDEILKVFGAERGFVFVWDENEQKLVFRSGRDAAKENLSEPKGYSSTVVRNVCEMKAPQIVTGSDELEELGSKSAIVNDLRSIISVPLLLKDQFKGVLYIDSRLTRGLFTADDLSLLMAIANHIGIAIESGRMAIIEAERREMAKDLEVSAAVQKMLLPETNRVESPNFELVSFYQPAVHCGGDWWWHHQCEDSLSLFVGDVTGHGVASAMVTACIASAFKVFKKQLPRQDFSVLLNQVNEELVELAQGDYLMSGFAAQLNLKTNQFKWWGVGGPTVLVLRADSTVEILGEPSTPLGIKPLEISTGEIQLQPKDRVFIYTDGITELTTKSGDQLGDRAFSRLLKTSLASPLERLPEILKKKIQEVSASGPQEDDFTLVAVEAKRKVP